MALETYTSKLKARDLVKKIILKVTESKKGYLPNVLHKNKINSRPFIIKEFPNLVFSFLLKYSH